MDQFEIVYRAPLLFVVYSVIVVSLIWGRVRFFSTKSKGSKKVALINDPAVAMQFFATYYFIFTKDPSVFRVAVGLIGYLAGLGIFWASVKAAGRLNFAMGESSNTLVSSGPFHFVRHPFYFSYILFWVSSSIVFNSMFLWLTAMVLFIVYFVSAKNEERDLLNGPCSKEYEKYKASVGMFIPKISILRKNNDQN